MGNLISAEEAQRKQEEREERLYWLFEQGRITLEELCELLDK